MQIAAAEECLFDIRTRQRGRFALVAEHFAVSGAEDNLRTLTFRRDSGTGEGSPNNERQQQWKKTSHPRPGPRKCPAARTAFREARERRRHGRPQCSCIYETDGAARDGGAPGLHRRGKTLVK